MTYNKILGAMKSAFYEKTGRDVECFSDLAVRFECVASELYSLFCRSEYVLKQAVPQLADGQYLDYHAALHGLERKTASKAQGRLTFSIGEARSEAVSVPSGTLCSVGENPYLQFITTEEGSIPAGAVSCEVSAQACENGSRYNVVAGSVTVAVNPPLYVTAVSNAEAFAHGQDEESDEALRTRLVRACSTVPNGFSEASVRELILRHTEVLDCSVYNGGDALTVLVKTKSGAVSEALRGYIEACAYIRTFTGAGLEVVPAVPRTYRLTVTAKCTATDKAALEAEIREALRRSTGNVGIGESVNLHKLACAVAKLDGVAYAEAASPDAEGDTIYSGYPCYLVPEEITVECYE